MITRMQFSTGMEKPLTAMKSARSSKASRVMPFKPYQTYSMHMNKQLDIPEDEPSTSTWSD